MTAQPIDTEALRAAATAAIEGYGPEAWPDIPSTALLALLDALAAAEHRATRAEAQSAIRGRAVAIHRERTREADARLKAVEDVLDKHETIFGADTLVPADRIRRALDGDA